MNDNQTTTRPRFMTVNDVQRRLGIQASEQSAFEIRLPVNISRGVVEEER